MYKFPRIEKFPELVCACSDKSDGNMSFTWGPRDEVLRNRKRFFDKLGIRPERVVGMNLTHGANIAFVDEFACGRDPIEADCLMTKSKNVFLLVLTGDCLPIVLYDPVAKILALAHLSRINASERFTQKIIRKFSEKDGNPEHITAAIGPGVRKESYIFYKEELAKRKIGDQWKDFLVPLPRGKIGVDLAGYNAHQLISAGVRRGHIKVANIDTIADKNFFSHYRSQKTGEPEGRIATIAGIN